MRPRAAVIGVCLLGGQTAGVIAYVARSDSSSTVAVQPSTAVRAGGFASVSLPSPEAARSAQLVADRSCGEKPFVGVVMARAAADVAPYREGRVSAVHVRIGDHVEAGDLLVTLDARVARAQRDKAAAQAKIARADVGRSAIDLDDAADKVRRAEALAQEGLVSGADLAAARVQQKTAMSRAEAARAQLLGARAAARELKHFWEETMVRAPFEGDISARFVDPGVNVSAGTPLVRIVDGSGQFVRFAVPEACAPRIHTDQRVAVVADRRNGLAVIERIAPEIDAASRMVVVEAAVTAGNDGWPVGAMVEVRP